MAAAGDGIEDMLSNMVLVEVFRCVLMQTPQIPAQQRVLLHYGRTQNTSATDGKQMQDVRALVRCRAVCRRWRDVGSDPRLWALVTVTLETSWRTRALAANIGPCIYAQSLELSRDLWRQYDKQCVGNIVRAMPQLTRIWCGQPHLAAAVIGNAPDGVKELVLSTNKKHAWLHDETIKRWDVQGVNFGAEHIMRVAEVMLTRPELVKIVVPCGAPASWESKTNPGAIAGALVVSHQRLRSVAINGSWLCDTSGERSFVDTIVQVSSPECGCEHVRELSVVRDEPYTLRVAGLRDLFPNLTVLEVCGCMNTGRVAAAALRLRSLVRLRISHRTKPRPGQVVVPMHAHAMVIDEDADIAELERSEPSRSLVELAVVDVLVSRADVLETLISKAPALRSLRLEDINIDSDEWDVKFHQDLSTAIATLPALRSLKLANIPLDRSTFSMRQIIEACPDLESIVSMEPDGPQIRGDDLAFVQPNIRKLCVNIDVAMIHDSQLMAHFFGALSDLRIQTSTLSAWFVEVIMARCVCLHRLELISNEIQWNSIPLARLASTPSILPRLCRLVVSSAPRSPLPPEPFHHAATLACIARPHLEIILTH